jgi:hypothetical protein
MVVPRAPAVACITLPLPVYQNINYHLTGIAITGINLWRTYKATLGKVKVTAITRPCSVIVVG